MTAYRRALGVEAHRIPVENQCDVGHVPIIALFICSPAGEAPESAKYYECKCSSSPSRTSARLRWATPWTPSNSWLGRQEVLGVGHGSWSGGKPPETSHSSPTTSPTLNLRHETREKEAGRLSGIHRQLHNGKRNQHYEEGAHRQNTKPCRGG